VPKSRKCGSINPLLHTPSWGNAQLVKHRDNFTSTFTMWRNQKNGETYFIGDKILTYVRFKKDLDETKWATPW
jgi:hypothetical protein